MRRWVQHNWRAWLADHPWTMLYLLSVTTVNFIFSAIEAVK